MMGGKLNGAKEARWKDVNEIQKGMHGESPAVVQIVIHIEKQSITSAKRWSRHNKKAITEEVINVKNNPSQKRKEMEVAGFDSHQIKQKQRKLTVDELDNKLKISVEADARPCSMS